MKPKDTINTILYVANYLSTYQINKIMQEAELTAGFMKNVTDLFPGNINLIIHYVIYLITTVTIQQHK